MSDEIYTINNVCKSVVNRHAKANELFLQKIISTEIKSKINISYT
jgi:hypothetical protein